MVQMGKDHYNFIDAIVDRVFAIQQQISEMEKERHIPGFSKQIVIDYSFLVNTARH